MRIEFYQGFKNGDRDSTNMVIEEHKIYVYNFCFKLTMNKHDADNLFQDSFLRAVRRCDKLPVENFKGWMRKICIDQYINYAKNYEVNYKKENSFKNKFFKKRVPDENIKDFITGNTKLPAIYGDNLNKNSVYLKLIDSIKKLPTDEKIIITLHYYDSTEDEEVAYILGLRPDIYREKLKIARGRIQKRMGSEIYAD